MTNKDQGFLKTWWLCSRPLPHHFRTPIPSQLELVTGQSPPGYKWSPPARELPLGAVCLQLETLPLDRDTAQGKFPGLSEPSTHLCWVNSASGYHLKGVHSPCGWLFSGYLPSSNILKMIISWANPNQSGEILKHSKFLRTNSSAVVLLHFQ